MLRLKEIDLSFHSRTPLTLISNLTPQSRRLLTIRIIVTFLIATIGFTYDWAFGALIQECSLIFNAHTISPSCWVLFGVVLFISAVQTSLPQIDGYIWRKSITLVLQRYEYLFATQRSKLDVAIEDNAELQNKVHRSTDSIHRVTEFLHHGIALVRGLVSFIVASLIIGSFSLPVFILVILSTLPELLIGMNKGKVIWSVYQSEGENRRRFSDYRTYLHSPGSIRDLKLLGASQYFLEKFMTLFSDFQSKELKAALRYTLLFMGSSCISFAGIGFALIFFLYQVADGTLKVSALIFAFGAILRFRASTEGLFHQLASMNSDGIFVSELHSFLALKPIISQKTDAAPLSQLSTPHIVFEDVWFRYQEDQNWILKGVSFQITPGTKLAIIGDNGAGKTTLVKLLCRFYDPTKGRILVDGIDLRDIQISDWWAHLGCLFQDFERYSLTIEELIALGDLRKDHELEKIANAGKKAGIDSMVAAWKDAWSQRIGRGYSNSIELSAGQHQRIALARLFYRDANIMLLDEPTSWVDVPTEGKIFRELRNLPSGRTLIFISHRFSTVRQADQILLLSEGTIGAEGNHQELLQNNNDYARRFEEEAQHYQN